MNVRVVTQHRPLQRADDYKLFSFDFVAHVLDDPVTLEVVLKMFYGLNVVENFQVPVEVGRRFKCTWHAVEMWSVAQYNTITIQ